MTTFTQLNAKLKNFLRGWLLVWGLKECLAQCATLYVKSEVILIHMYLCCWNCLDWNMRIAHIFYAFYLRSLIFFWRCLDRTKKSLLVSTIRACDVLFRNSLGKILFGLLLKIMQVFLFRNILFSWALFHHTISQNYVFS